MIQFNLLPDVKLQYLKARRMSQLVITISVIATLAALAVLVLLLSTVYVFQKKSLDDLNNNVAQYSNQLEGTPNLDKILTVQNQLSVLTSLHNQKAVASRLFTYLEQITPSTASVSQLNIDYTANTISITGDANSLDVVNTYVDTLKFTTYKVAGSNAASAPDAFSSVVLSSFTINSSDATYTITANFDPTIFNNADNVTLSVPDIISTRSEVEQPSDLFKSHATAESGQ